MADFTTENLRTVALVGPGAAGKTSLAEALLSAAGMIGAPGSIEKGTTVCDFDPLEKTYQHSLRASLAHLDHAGTRVHLIDTPGYPDFIGQAIGALDAVETAAVVVNAAAGIEPIAARMMQWAKARNLCRVVIVNKIDADNIDLPALLARIRETFGRECLPINLPGDGRKRVIDCFFNPAGEADFLSAAEVHRMVTEQIVEVDEGAMAKYLEQGDVAPEALHAPLEQALREGHLVPVCFTSARTGAGVRELLEVFVRLLPHPGEGNPPLFYKGEGAGEGKGAESFRSAPDRSRHALAHVFKIVNDPYIGKIGIFRVHQGTLRRDSQLYVGEAKKAFKAGHLFLLQGKEQVEVNELVPGDLGAVAKVEEIAFDSVLHDSRDEDRIHMRPLEFPRPMVGLAIEPRRRGDENRISEILGKIAAEDPTLAIEHDPQHNETVLRGLSEMHLRTVLERMATQYRLEVTAHPPRIPFRETVTQGAEGHHRHKKQTGGAGQFGEVSLRVEPLARGAGVEFVDHVKGGVIPTQFIPAVEKGIRQVLAAGPLAGCPMQDVRIIVHDGKHHPVDSKEVAFVAAGRKAFLDAIEKARPIVLEPVVAIEITAPEANMGDITGDLASRRGEVTGTRNLGANVIVSGEVPLSELDGYANRLKSFTAGQGSYAIELSRYDPVPPPLQQTLVNDYKAQRKQEED